MYHSPSAVDGSAIQLCVPHRRHNHVHIRMEVVQTSASHPLIWYKPSTRQTCPPFPPVRRHRAANSFGSVCVCVRVGGSAYNATHPNSVVQYIICSQQRVLMRTVARHAWVRAWLLCPHTHTYSCACQRRHWRRRRRCDDADAGISTCHSFAQSVCVCVWIVRPFWECIPSQLHVCARWRRRWPLFSRSHLRRSVTEGRHRVEWLVMRWH